MGSPPVLAGYAPPFFVLLSKGTWKVPFARENPRLPPKRDHERKGYPFRKAQAAAKERPRAQSSPLCKARVAAKENPRAQTFPVSQSPGRCQVKVLCFSLSREKKNSRPRGAAVFFVSTVSQHTDTRPVWASRVTTAPLFKRSVACSAPVMTGLSMARPAIAAWELAPDSSVMMPEALRR